MSISTQLKTLIGEWRGTNKLWMNPEDPARESDSTMVISLAAKQKFIMFQYIWADEGDEQEGLLVVSGDPKTARAQGVWVDSWHMQDNLMVCDGSLEPGGGFSVCGTYAAPPGPDWGWRITMGLRGPDTLGLTMHNFSPDGQGFLAVETIYQRVS